MIRTVRIFLSSPGDVAAERAKARELLLGLARGPFVRGRVLIDVVSWDDPHAPAQMDARLTPQQAVDRSLPTPAQCDLTVVLLWGRMGTPLTEKKADGAPYLSGTEWEFDDALNANKPVFLYRRSEKVLLDPDDPKFDDKLTQKRRVDSFFARLVGEGGAILRAHAAYTSLDDLLTRLRQDVESYLSNVLLEADGDAAGEDGERADAHRGRRGSLGGSRPDVPVAYRDWVKKRYGGVDLLGLQLKKGRPPSLSAIYVTQTTTTAAAREEQQTGRGRPRAGIDADMPGRERERHTLALNRLATESLYMSGAPGTGKSTFCRWVAWLVAEGAMPSLDVSPPDAFAEVLDDGLRGRLPVLLKLREFWELLPSRVGASLTISDVEAAMGHWVDQRGPEGLDPRLLRAHLAHGSALLLLDGMDEVPVSITTSTGRWHPWVITLPSEAEWEKAARGKDARIYPWAGDFNASNANGFETGLGTTSAVGLFPNGASPCGALDMSGNVWEWTRSLWGEDFGKPDTYPYKPKDGKRENLAASDKILRVLRGGSFFNNAGNLRAANRYRNFPDLRSSRIGFRVVSSRLRS